MSRRSTDNASVVHAAQLQKELQHLKEVSVAANIADNAEASGAEAAPNAPSFDSLSGTEKAVAYLGVHPDHWKPISFMNNKHYDALKTANVLDADLARRIDAYRVVASQ